MSIPLIGRPEGDDYGFERAGETGSLAINGGGTLTVDGAETYSGATLIFDDSTLIAGSTNDLDPTSVYTVDAGSTLDIGGANQKIAGLSGAGTLTDNAVTAATLHLSGGGSQTFSGLIKQISGAIALDFDADETLTDGANSFSGGATIESGFTLGAGASGSLGSGQVTMAGGSTLALTSASDMALGNAISFSGTANISLTHFFDFISGEISNSASGELVVEGGGGLVLDGSNTYTTDTLVNGSVLDIFADNGVGVGGAVDLENSAGLDLNGTYTFDHNLNVEGSSGVNIGSGKTVTLSGTLRDFNSPGSLNFNGGGVGVLTGFSEYTGATTVSSGFTLRAGGGTNLDASSVYTVDFGATLDLGNGFEEIGGLAGAGSVITSGGVGTTKLELAGLSDNTFSGTIQQGSGHTLNLEIAGSGVQTLSGANSYTGFTQIFGSLSIGNDDNLGNTSEIVMGPNGTLNVTQSLTLSESLFLTDQNTIDVTTGDTLTLSGPVEDFASSTPGSLVLQGGGSLTLTDFNSFSGGVTIDSGTLVVNGSSAGGGPITFGAGAGAELELASGVPTGNIAGIQGGDQILLTGIDATAATPDGAGHLVISINGNPIEQLSLATTPTGLFFVCETVAGGTDIVVLNDPATVAQYTAQTADYDQIPGGVAISDSLPAIVGDLSALNADPHIASLTATSGAATLTGSTPIDAPSFSLTGSGTTLTLAENLNYTGALSAGAGTAIVINANDTLTLTGKSTLAGAISGAGVLTLGGSAAINAGAKLTQANWTLAGAATAVTLNENLSYGGAFVQNAAPTLAIPSRDTLTLTGTSTLDGAISGAGDLTLAGGDGDQRRGKADAGQVDAGGGGNGGHAEREPELWRDVLAGPGADADDRRQKIR